MLRCKHRDTDRHLHIKPPRATGLCRLACGPLSSNPCAVPWPCGTAMAVLTEDSSAEQSSMTPSLQVSTSGYSMATSTLMQTTLTISHNGVLYEEQKWERIGNCIPPSPTQSVDPR